MNIPCASSLPASLSTALDTKAKSHPSCAIVFNLELTTASLAAIF